MKRLIQRLLAYAACLVFCGAWSAGASAALVTSQFDGTVSGYRFGFLDANSVAFDNDHPVGTTVHWDMTYDDSFLGLGMSDLLALGNLAVSGALQVGADNYAFTSMRFFTLNLAADFNTITAYGPQVSATGPGTSDGGDFFAMFWRFAPDLSMLSAASIGYGYTNGFSTAYGYLETAGEYRVGPANAAPEPSTALLLLPALLLLRRRRKAR